MSDQTQAPKPTKRHRTKKAEDTLIIERVYHPDIERQMAALCLLLGLPYKRPTQKANQEDN